VTVLEQRAEQVTFAPGAAGILVRAVAPLERLCALLQAPLAAGGRLLAMKGAQWEQEWAPLNDRYTLEARYAYRVPSYDHERVLLKVRSKDAA
jgi:16S rRNA G527 N7-methylase RsmG